ncbi:mitochondrial small subunit ribosomal protein S28 [Rhodotorula toruloides]|uniref:Mitochondrial small subunit ribosomal protein S28 n=1 Tax=Rhodotorula toruloides TaxID=5286 RepID=A0A511KNI7_RHOTO|nr:mitochondrial small subunit ribosomal protein S28 [Rhodotorula toruloides]
MLARIALQTARAPFAAAASSSLLPLASTSSAPAAVALPAHARAFSATAPAGETKAKRKARMTRRANLDKKAALVRELEATRPDPVLGYQKGHDELWENCLLNKITLKRKDVWGEVVPIEETGAAAAKAGEGEAKDGQRQEPYVPKYFNFGLDAETVEQLSDTLPATSALRSTLGDKATSVDAVLLSRFEDATTLEAQKREHLMRILDLRNADSKGIEAYNKRLIVQTFGRVENDSGSPEVQAAILTLRIRNIFDHLKAAPTDVPNRQVLRLLVHKRGKILKYLRAVSVTRYEELLLKIGVEPRSVEGEIIMRKNELRSLIRGTDV